MDPTTIAINGNEYDVLCDDEGQPSVYIPNGLGAYERATDRMRFTASDVLRALGPDFAIIVARRQCQTTE